MLQTKVASTLEGYKSIVLDLAVRKWQSCPQRWASSRSRLGSTPPGSPLVPCSSIFRSSIVSKLYDNFRFWNTNTKNYVNFNFLSFVLFMWKEMEIVLPYCNLKKKCCCFLAGISIFSFCIIHTKTENRNCPGVFQLFVFWPWSLLVPCFVIFLS